MDFKEVLPVDCQIRRLWPGYGYPGRATKYGLLESHIEPL